MKGGNGVATKELCSTMDDADILPTVVRRVSLPSDCALTF